MFDCITKLVKIKRLMLSNFILKQMTPRMMKKKMKQITDYLRCLQWGEMMNLSTSSHVHNDIPSKIKLIDQQLMKLCSRAACT